MNSNLARQTRTAGGDSATPIPSSSNSTQILMDKWIEPPLRTPAPSFMDEPQRHIERHGVLQTMAPLGTPPSSKVKKAAKAEESRKANLVLKEDISASTTPPPRQVMTPEPAPSAARRMSGSVPVEDEEYDPKTPQAQTRRKSNTMGSGIPRQSLPPRFSPSVSMSLSPTKEERELLAADRVVQAAVEEALTKNRLCTAYALRTLYNDHRSNPRITSLMDNIFRQHADELQRREFASLMHYKKKEGRKGGKAKRWFDENDNAYNPPSLFSSSWTLQSSPARRPALDSNSASNHLSKSPHKEMAGHVSKKLKANSYHDDNDDAALETNGTNGRAHLANGSLSRSRSNSTSSSLSSLDEELLSFSPANAERSQARAKANNSAHAGERRAGSSTQPMAQDTTPGPKLHDSPTTKPITSSASTTQTPTHLANANDAPIMPAAYSEPAVFPQQQPSSHPVHLKLQKKITATTPQPGDDEREDRLRMWKKQAKAVTDRKSGIKDSFDRDRIVKNARSAKEVDKVVESESDADSVARITRGARSGTVLRFRSSQAARPANDESDDLSSPTLLSFQNDVGPGSSLNSRAGTPNTLNRPSRKPKGLGGLRTKTSPMKKKTGPSAGLPRASGERNSPVGNGAPSHNPDDNDDYCSACGGNGDLVCCDGCTRSFHFRCVDPPMVEGQLPDSWYCNLCNALRNPPTTDDVGSFVILNAQLERKNPSAFHLPKQVREYFEGVRTGSEGEYEDGVQTRSKRGAGYEEPPDYLRLKDNKGNFILCHECHSSAAGGRPIIPCTYCGLQWHLDCVDPPMANPPPAGKSWRCPCHVDDLLSKIPSSLGPAHRFRKIKNASVVRPAIPRGSRNMGQIDIEFDDSDDDDQESDSGFFDRKEFGKIYRLPVEGIKLDFISRVRTLRSAEEQERPRPLGYGPISDFASRSIFQQQAALNLAQLHATAATPDDAQLLIDALLTEADPSIINLIARGDASDLANGADSALRKPSNRHALLAMKAMIDAQLFKMDIDEESPVSINQIPTPGKDVQTADGNGHML